MERGRSSPTRDVYAFSRRSAIIDRHLFSPWSHIVWRLFTTSVLIVYCQIRATIIVLRHNTYSVLWYSTRWFTDLILRFWTYSERRTYWFYDDTFDDGHHFFRCSRIIAPIISDNTSEVQRSGSVFRAPHNFQ